MSKRAPVERLQLEQWQRGAGRGRDDLKMGMVNTLSLQWHAMGTWVVIRKRTGVVVEEGKSPGEGRRQKVIDCSRLALAERDLVGCL